MSDASKGKAPSVFISYRIADTLLTADRLAAELRRRFGDDEVFFDRRTLEPGEEWHKRIETAVKDAAFVLVLIGKKWLTEQNDYGIRRLDVPGDWVRLEVEAALTKRKRVIPVLVDDAAPPPEAAFRNLPSLVALASCQGALLRTREWDRDFGVLADLLTSRGLRVAEANTGSPAITPPDPQMSEPPSESEAYHLLCDADSCATFEGAKALLDRINPSQFTDPDLVTCIVFSKGLVEFCLAAGVPRDASGRVSSFLAMMQEVNRAALLRHILREGPLKTLGTALTIRRQINQYPDMMLRLSQKYGPGAVASHRPGKSRYPTH
jgi:hypothetical protein